MYGQAALPPRSRARELPSTVDAVRTCTDTRSASIGIGRGCLSDSRIGATRTSRPSELAYV